MKLRRVKFVAFPFISTGIIYVNNIHLDNLHNRFFYFSNQRVKFVRIMLNTVSI